MLAIRLLARSAAALLCLAVAAGAGASPFDPFVESDVIEILTVDEDGENRETKIWIVVLDQAGWIRTNDTRWLANIRRDPDVAIRAGDVVLPVRAEISEDREDYDRVEAGFKEKYGFVQKVMSFFRMSEPTVLRLEPRSPSTGAG
jgi:hypothetical protein